MITIPREIQARLSYLPGAYENVTQPLYDTMILNASKPTSFFQSAIGQDGKRFSETNMYIAGMLPQGMMFLIEGLSVIVLPTKKSPFAEIKHDMWHYYSRGVVQLNIGAKNYLTMGPLACFVPNHIRKLVEIFIGQRFPKIDDGESGLIEAPPAMSLGDNKLMLEPGERFNVVIDGVRPATPKLKVMVSLNGQMFRSVA